MIPPDKPVCAACGAPMARREPYHRVTKGGTEANFHAAKPGEALRPCTEAAMELYRSGGTITFVFARRERESRTTRESKARREMEGVSTKTERRPQRTAA